MATDILMPNLGFDTQTGRLVEWLKEPGSAVQKGEAIAVVESDKANVELEAIISGILLEHLVAPDQEIAIGSVIARIGCADEYRPGAAAPAAAIAEATAQAEPIPPAAGSSASRVSPLAQRMARELQVDVEQIAGSGARGRVTRSDVQQAFQQAQPTPVMSPARDPLGDAQGHSGAAGRAQGCPRARHRPVGSAGGRLRQPDHAGGAG
ncbi:MAG: E3 binding domain-containing protein [Chloroflexi bacterium]|nr:E3 binding domain-containing protein [Chloroflexota bacterium]